MNDTVTKINEGSSSGDLKYPQQNSDQFDHQLPSVANLAQEWHQRKGHTVTKWMEIFWEYDSVQ